ncbi:hypothetical protein AAFF_G00093980 [Aldrovandia affinis]|uniref:XK-related protein n=1 Tax=Aldrovandia affinis TaxID=143900 RepID=A0AAD7T2W5_9TELE|nr:hypothetical protein AAFF_G00093980 [Aldrovandia affinis]
MSFPEMPNTRTKFTVLRYLHIVVGVTLYVVDVGTDIWVAAQFGCDGHYTWFTLTLSLVLSGSLVTQIFSYTWFSDDIKRRESSCEMTRPQLILPHILQFGIFIRYFQLLKKGISAIHSNNQKDHREMFAMATDMSMLRLFETFLESAPQLLLQLYIILGHNHRSAIQYVCIAGSFLSIAWATVDYRRWFRRSLSHINEMPSGLPTAVYLFYKLFTITSRILSLSLLVVLNVYCTLALAVVWLCGTIWAHVLKTDFCTSRFLEWFYRGVIGVILIFTFFNVKGQGIRVSMIIYYELYVLQNLAALLSFYFFKSSAETPGYFWPVTFTIVGTNVIGLICLSLFYAFLHPSGQRPVVERVADEVDGQEQRYQIAEELGIKSSEMRMEAFLQY